MHIRLAELRTGEKARVLGFNPDINSSYLQRLLAMGLVPNTEFVVVRVAPLGDPVEIRVGNFSLCIRKEEGSILRLERLRHA